MQANVGTSDRILRALAGLAMLALAVIVPAPLLVRAGLLAGTGSYLVLTALVGSCLGYRMMGRSTCAVRAPR